MHRLLIIFLSAIIAMALPSVGFGIADDNTSSQTAASLSDSTLTILPDSVIPADSMAVDTAAAADTIALPDTLNTVFYQRGLGTYYGRKFHGRRTASGERFDMNKMTAAHRSLPFGTLVRVTNERNGRSVIVKVNDRGPGSRRLIIDVSQAAARELGILNHGTAPVTLEIVNP